MGRRFNERTQLSPPMGSLSTSSPINPPATQEIESEPLRCLDGDGTALSTRHPFAAIKETNRASGAWRLRIQSRHAASAVLYPNAIRLQARAVSAQGKSSFTWTNPVSGSAGAAKLQLRVLVNDGEPAAIEIFPQASTQNSAGKQMPVKFCWPAACAAS
jgi:hypothetical protein